MSAPHETIQLRGTPVPLEIPREHTYFAFADGRFSYDCVSCGAKCCRGYGYSIAAGPELDAQLADRPAIKVFLQAPPSRHERNYRVHNCAPSCYFLDERSQCAIQVGRGRDAKPETCRLFPFNNIRRSAGYLIVTPHSGLCPLEVVAPGSYDHASRHDTLFEEMRRGGIGADVSEVRCLLGDAGAAIELERHIVEQSERCVNDDDYVAFADAQVAATAAALRDRGAWSGAATSGTLSAFVDRLATVLDIAPAATPDPALLRTMLASTPFLRSQLVFGGKAHADGPDVGLDRVPHVLLALHTFVTLARDAGMRQITYQTIGGLFRQYRPLLAMLAYADCEMVWKPSAGVDWPFRQDKSWEGRYLAIVKDLLPARRRSPHPVLGDILERHAAGAGVTRVMFLSQVANKIADRIVPAAGAAANGRSPRAFRNAAQHWVLGHFNQDVLVSVADRIAARPVRAPANPAS